MADAIRSAGSLLLNVQVSENDRGTVGSGHVDFHEAFRTLVSLCYTGPIVVESFRQDITEIAAAVALWRPVAATMDELARDSIKFHPGTAAARRKPHTVTSGR